MLLHDAIIEILKNINSPLSSGEIAGKISQNNLYKKRDGSPVTSSQISARINKYPHLFERCKDGIMRRNKSKSILLPSKRKKQIHTLSEPVNLKIRNIIIEDEDVTILSFLNKMGFKNIGDMDKLMKNGLPNMNMLNSCGVYAITVPNEYKVAFIPMDKCITNNNVVNPWPIRKLQKKWVEGVDVIYFGLAGKSSFRTLKRRLVDLISHCSGKTTNSGPHKGGEILWQLVGYKQFECWILPTENPPKPREVEKYLIRAFEEIMGKLPFANRQH